MKISLSFVGAGLITVALVHRLGYAYAGGILLAFDSALTLLDRIVG